MSLPVPFPRSSRASAAPKSDTLLTLAAALNVTIDDLLSYHPDPGYILARSNSASI